VLSKEQLQQYSEDGYTVVRGLYDSDHVDARIPLDPETLVYAGIVADVIPNPPETRLLRDAAARGCTTLDGLGMLVAQGAIGFEYWTGISPDEVRNGGRAAGGFRRMILGAVSARHPLEPLRAPARNEVGPRRASDRHHNRPRHRRHGAAANLRIADRDDRHRRRSSRLIV
jgi:hypothetical protein